MDAPQPAARLDPRHMAEAEQRKRELESMLQQANSDVQAARGGKAESAGNIVASEQARVEARIGGSAAAAAASS